MEMLNPETLKNLVPRTSINGIILVKNYSVQLTKNNKEYIVGELQAGTSISFKAWGDSVAFTRLKNEDYQNCPSIIQGNVDDYGGSISIVLDTVQAVDGYTADQFLPIKYNMDAYVEALINQVKAKVSPKGFDLCNEILFNNKDLLDRFKVEFAAMNNHDNCKSGLLAHSYKVFSNMSLIINQYPTLVTRDNDEETSDFKDLLFIGALLHDIGKIKEMNFGVYQDIAIVTHQYLGVELLNSFKDRIIEVYDEYWWYQLVSILLQHHGKYGEPCKTLASFLVHTADMLDSNLTLLAQRIEAQGIGARVKIDDYYLTV